MRCQTTIQTRNARRNQANRICVAWRCFAAACLTLLGPAAAKRQPSKAPATRSVAARRGCNGSQRETSCCAARGAAASQNAPNMNTFWSQRQTSKAPGYNIYGQLTSEGTDQLQITKHPSFFHPSFMFI